MSGVDCFIRGTHILTQDGECRVEDLTEGQLVLTTKGEYKPVTWIGRRLIQLDGLSEEDRRALLPVVIRQGAVGENVPHRDLYVSVNHGIGLGEYWAAAGWLLNGETICRCTGVSEFEYFHIDCGSHEMVYAEGLTVETYVDMGNRRSFDNAEEFYARYPHAQPATAVHLYVRPLTADSPELHEMRAALKRRATEQRKRVAA